jgi:hypothetical protein
MHVGGNWDKAGGAGLFCLNLNNPVSNAATWLGCRLARHWDEGARRRYME